MPTPLPIPNGPRVSTRTMQELVRRVNAISAERPDSRTVSARWYRFATDAEVVTAEAAGKVPSGEADNDLKIRNVQQCGGTVVQADCVSRWGIWHEIDWCSKSRVDQDLVFDLIFFPSGVEEAPATPGAVDPTIAVNCHSENPFEDPTATVGGTGQQSLVMCVWNPVAGRWEAITQNAIEIPSADDDILVACIGSTQDCCMLEAEARIDSKPQLDEMRQLEPCRDDQGEPLSSLICTAEATLRDIWVLVPSCTTPECALVKKVEECVACNGEERDLYAILTSAECGCCPDPDHRYVTATFRYWCDGVYAKHSVCLQPTILDLQEGTCTTDPYQPKFTSGISWNPQDCEAFDCTEDQWLNTKVQPPANEICATAGGEIRGNVVWTGVLRVPAKVPVHAVWVNDGAGHEAAVEVGTGCDDCVEPCDQCFEPGDPLVFWHVGPDSYWYPGSGPGFIEANAKTTPTGCTLITTRDDGVLERECTLAYLVMFWCCVVPEHVDEVTLELIPEQITGTEMRILHIKPQTDQEIGIGTNLVQVRSFGDFQSQDAGLPCLNVSCTTFDYRFGDSGCSCDVKIGEAGETVGLQQHGLHVFGGTCVTCQWQVNFTEAPNRSVEIYYGGVLKATLSLDDDLMGRSLTAAQALLAAIPFTGETVALGPTTTDAVIVASGRPDVELIFYTSGVEDMRSRPVRLWYRDASLDDTCQATDFTAFSVDPCNIKVCFSW